MWCQDEAGPYQAIPQPGPSWQPAGRPARRPHEYVRGGTAKLLTLPGYGSVLDARRLQRVPDLLLQMGVITSKVDAAPMIAPQVTS